MSAAAAGQRVVGWDLLRGLCALAVASYHLLHWQGLADLHSLASYGVYLFFVLSGASLAYTYGDRLNATRPVLRFWWTRWWRLAPLYAVVCVVWLLMLDARLDTPVDRVAWRLALNLSFAFGLHDPVVWALPVGGWSLGIEFVYYLLCPVVLWALQRPAWALVLTLPVLTLQGVWIAMTLGAPGGYAANGVAYHQVPAFGAYFVAGCAIGLWRRRSATAWPPSSGVLVWALLFVLLLALNPGTAGDELTGWRGGLLPAICIVAVALSAPVRLAGRADSIARRLGDATYGVYLLHPLLYFGFAWFVAPRWGVSDWSQMPEAWRWALWPSLLLWCGVLALASEHGFEAPLRQRMRRC